MTDRIGAIIVTLDKDIRDDDIQHTLNALRQIKHVLKVEPVVTDYNEHMARARVNRAWANELYEIISKMNS